MSVREALHKLVDALSESDLPTATRLLEDLTRGFDSVERSPATMLCDERSQIDALHDLREVARRRLILDLAGSGLCEGDLSEMRGDTVPGKERPDSR